jgi:hypothetical protein
MITRHNPNQPQTSTKRRIMKLKTLLKNVTLPIYRSVTRKQTVHASAQRVMQSTGTAR